MRKKIDFTDFVDMTKALADENRLRALMLLRDSPLCVCQIIEILELAPSTVSKHMSILRQARLVHSLKQGRWMHYSLAEESESQAVAEAIRWVIKHLEKDPKIINDQKKLHTLKKIDKVELCKRQKIK